MSIIRKDLCAIKHLNKITVQILFQWFDLIWVDEVRLLQSYLLHRINHDWIKKALSIILGQHNLSLLVGYTHVRLKKKWYQK